MELNPFLQKLHTACAATKKRVLLAEGEDLRTIAAARSLVKKDFIASVGLFGRSKTISGLMNEDLSNGEFRKITIYDQDDSNLINDTLQVCLETARSKGKDINERKLNEQSRKPIYQAGAILARGQADCALAGAVEATSEVIRAALATVGLSPKISTVSGSFFMNRSLKAEDLTYLFADAGVVIDPTENQLIDIALGSVASWQKIMDTPPVVAFLSFSTKGSAIHPSAEKMCRAANRFKELMPHIKADGELQFDAAFDTAVGIRKAPGSHVAGHANIFIFPDLNSGNIAYKITQRLGNFDAYGPILQGLAKPYSDLSRGASSTDIYVSAIINAIRSTS